MLPKFFMIFFVTVLLKLRKGLVLIRVGGNCAGVGMTSHTF